MTTLFELWSEDPLENVITCLNYKIDKIVFFLDQSISVNSKDVVNRFLQVHCGVKAVHFVRVDVLEINAVSNKIQQLLEKEINTGARVYVDVTGGNDRFMIASGILSAKRNIPMHVFDINNNAMEILNDPNHAYNKLEIQKRNIGIKDLIRLHGGIVNTKLHKNVKSLDDADFRADVDAIYGIAAGNWLEWNQFSNVIKSVFMTDRHLVSHASLRWVLDSIKSNSDLDTPKKINDILDKLSECGIITDLKHDDGIYHFTYKNEMIKDCLWDGGSVLELYTCKCEKENSDECSVGVHIDWDGMIHEQPGKDVLNEIDVLSVKDNIITFISCKSGRMGSQQSLHALYELDTVANRFGGKYSRKVLATGMPLADIYMERAEEMRIEVRVFSK